MLGQPFRDDPGVPALYGATLIISRGAGGVLRHGILLFALLEIATVYAFARAFWGRARRRARRGAGRGRAGQPGHPRLARPRQPRRARAARAAVRLPRELHGSARASGRRGRADVGHRSTAAPGRLRADAARASRRRTACRAPSLVAVTGLVVLACLISPSRRRRALRDALWLAGLTLVLGAGVLADLYAREKTLRRLAALHRLPRHEGQPDPDAARRLADARRRRRGGARGRGAPPPARRARCGARWRCWPSSWRSPTSWIVHVPNYYARMIFYVPLAAAPLVAAVAVRLPWPLARGRGRGDRHRADDDQLLRRGGQHPRLLLVRHAGVAARAGRALGGPAPERGRRHRPLLELPVDLAAAHAHARRARAAGHPARRGAAVRARGPADPRRDAG